MAQTRFPPGWDDERVQEVLAHYEAAVEMRGQTVMEVPSDLVPAVRELIAKHSK